MEAQQSLPLVIEHYQEGVWFDLRHATIWEVLQEKFDLREEIDLITVQRALKDRNQLEAVGGLAYLSALQDTVPSAANLPAYLDILKEKHQLRQMIQTCSAVVAKVYECEKDASAMMDAAERDVLGIRQQRTQRGVLAVKELMQRNMATIDVLSNANGSITGLSTGFLDLDRKINGMEGGELIIIGGRPSSGKTSAVMNIAECVAVDQQRPVAVFSLEMMAEALSLRMVCSRSKTNLRDIRDGLLPIDGHPKIVTASIDISKAPLYIDDTSGLTILQLRARARRLWQQHQIQLVVVDYLQLLKGTKKSEKRMDEIAEISSGLKELAKELCIPVIALAQLNRNLEKEKNRRPQLSDLREGGNIEQDADKVLLLYREEKEEDEKPTDEATKIGVSVAKQRNGETGTVHLDFYKKFTRFESLSKFDDSDMFGK